MSHQLWNIHNYSKPPQAQPAEFLQPNGVPASCIPTESQTRNNQQSSHQLQSSSGQNGFYQEYLQQNGVLNNGIPTIDLTRNNQQSTSSSVQNGLYKGPACMFTNGQEAVVSPTIDSTSWREKASIEDWKAYLLSTQPMPVNRKPQSIGPPTVPYGTDASSVMNNRIPQQHPTAHISYSYAFNGGFKPMVGHTTKRYSGAIDNRRAFMEKLRMNNTAVKDWFQSRLLENRMKTEYNYYPPGLLERIRLEKEKIRMGLAHVEMLMNHPNEYGYVTLDDRAMNVLVTVIDRILPKNMNMNMGNLQGYRY